jgi:hypothetical protein
MSRVWQKFTSLKSGQSFRIQDVPSDRLDDVIDLFVNYFAKEETLHKAAGKIKPLALNCDESEDENNEAAIYQSN